MFLPVTVAPDGLQIIFFFLTSNSKCVRISTVVFLPTIDILSHFMRKQETWQLVVPLLQKKRKKKKKSAVGTRRILLIGSLTTVFKMAGEQCGFHKPVSFLFLMDYFYIYEMHLFVKRFNYTIINVYLSAI